LNSVWCTQMASYLFVNTTCTDSVYHKASTYSVVICGQEIVCG